MTRAILADTVYELASQSRSQSFDYFSERSLSDQDCSLLKESFLRTGLIIATGLPLKTLADIDFCSRFVPGTTIKDYRGGTNRRDKHGGSVFTVGTEPPFANVAAHNEMSYSFYDEYPGYFIMGCVSSPAKGGESLIGDNIAITEALMKTAMGARLFEYGVRYIRNFYDENSSQKNNNGLRSWQDGFGVQTKSEAEEILSTIRVDDFQWNSNGDLVFRYTRPAFEWHDGVKENLCFFSTGNHGYWFRNWPPYNILPNHLRPFHLTYGNGQELSEDELSLFAKIGVENSITHAWRPGDIVAVDNLLFTHGRKPFSLKSNETRKIGVLMKDLKSRQGIL